MKTVYFVRHGETEGNSGKMYQQFTTPLSETGHTQAEKVARRFATISHDVIFASHLTRAQQTAASIQSVSGKPVLTEELFQERIRPSLIRGKHEDDPEAKAIAAHLKQHYYSMDTSKRHSDEEFFFEIKARAERALALLQERPEQHIVVVLHREILAVICARIVCGEFLTPEVYASFWKHTKHSNTGITQCTYSPDSGWVLRSWNDTTHLG